ncbi:MAG: hypothetical protein EOO08_04735 [Chitinophagaceae bacterium]|nr:MAG: hypothetical protein EOO08_04735 [Chitinophagaceae bacterium]
MEKNTKLNKPHAERLSSFSKTESNNLISAAIQWGEKEILALQEKARQFQRRYPAGGYQGL